MAISSALCVALCVAFMASALAADAAPSKKRLLLVTHTAGFRHQEGIDMGEIVFRELGSRSGLFEVESVKTAEDVRRMLTIDSLRRFDGVIFNNTSGDIGIPDLPAFLAWLRTGKAFIGVHAATDTYGNQPAYIEMVGGQFLTHGNQTEVQIIVGDRRHPATSMLPNPWVITDEIYIFRVNNRANVRALLYLDRHPNDGLPNANQPGDHLLAWNRMYGRGRVFYTALGHRKDVWENPLFQQHLLGGIRWALGLARGESRPLPLPAAAPAPAR
ncbi:MAG TPA: ThuA domain-containing protein [Chthonomonadales bacterium]|nr:ThuA domain-containing protein [Chthonomonadales bacterium]